MKLLNYVLLWLLLLPLQLYPELLVFLGLLGLLGLLGPWDPLGQMAVTALLGVMALLVATVPLDLLVP
jgi:hypothetical protein